MSGGTSFSMQLRLLLPGMVALLLLLVCALPIALRHVTLTPHVVWLATLCVGVVSPAAWPPVLAFTLGLASDFVYGTPLGSQALITLLLTLYTQTLHRRIGHALFLPRWLQAAVALLLCHVLLWVLVGLVMPVRMPLLGLLKAALVSSLWYPLFHIGMGVVTSVLPSRG